MQRTHPLSEWLSQERTPPTQLYAILAGTSESRPLKAYYQHDGAFTPHGLYSQTPYADWSEVMPMIVPLHPGSAFLSWVENTSASDWGWLAFSPCSFEAVCDHLRGLTKVRLPDNRDVFFRYWDGQFLPDHIHFMGKQWPQILPVFSDYWINGEIFSFSSLSGHPAQPFPWWHIPQALIDRLSASHPDTLISLFIKQLKEQSGVLYQQFDEAVLKKKIGRLLQRAGKPEHVSLDEVIRALTADC